MTKNLKSLAGYTLTALILGAALLLAASAGQARTAQAAAMAPVSWRQQTCAAFTAYQAHPTAGSLATLVTDSTHLPKSYLKADVGQLYADASSPSAKAAKYAAKDAQYVAEDCAS